MLRRLLLIVGLVLATSSFVAPVKGATVIIDNYQYSSAFSPSNLPNLILWLDASDISTITQSSGSVSQWNDKSGNGYNATQATSANQPVTNSRTINGINVLDFDGTNDMFAVPSISGLDSANFTVFCIYTVDDYTTQLQSLITAYRTTVGNSTYGLTLNGTAANQISFSARFSAGSWATISHIHNGSPQIAVGRRNSTTQQVWNGNGITASNTSAQSLGASLNGTGIGSRQAGQRHFNGVIAEIIMYNVALSDTEVNMVAAYLSSKWAVSWVNIASIDILLNKNYAVNDNFEKYQQEKIYMDIIMQ